MVSSLGIEPRRSASYTVAWRGHQDEERSVAVRDHRSRTVSPLGIEPRRPAS
jgi:hypothetical protein